MNSTSLPISGSSLGRSSVKGSRGLAAFQAASPGIEPAEPSPGLGLRQSSAAFELDQALRIQQRLPPTTSSVQPATSSKRAELLVFAALIAIFNARVLGGSCWRAMMFEPEAVLRGEWWRVVTHPFVHVTWYHLLLDATAFFSLYAGFLERHVLRRLGYVIAAAAGSLVFSWANASSPNQTLCGLSGIAHGLMAVSALEMIATSANDRASARLGWLCFAIVIIKAGFEAVTGKMFFDFLHFGLLGHPVAVSHAGGVVGALAMMLLFTWLSQKRPNTLT